MLFRVQHEYSNTSLNEVGQHFSPYPCSAKWQERNAALEEVSSILKGAGGHVQPCIGNLLSLLKV